MQFKVANFEMTYNAFLGRLALTKFMATPHYAYLVLKRPGPNGIITIKADVKHTNIYDRESCDTSDRIIVSTELQELNKALPGSPTPPPTLIILEAKSFKTSIHLEESLNKMIPLFPDEPSKVAYVGM
jgi:hypothetical protein